MMMIILDTSRKARHGQWNGTQKTLGINKARIMVMIGQIRQKMMMMMTLMARDSRNSLIFDG